MKTGAHLLVVDDDREICDLIRHFFERHGYRVTVAHDEAQMQARLRRCNFDLVVLDVMLPGRNGLELCRDFRAKSQVPIIMVTAVGETTDRIVGLEMGADDYLAKPFDPRELLARARAVIRRFSAASEAGKQARPAQTYNFAGWTLDVAQRRLWSDDNVVVTLTTAEFDLLSVFVMHPRRTLSRDQLLDLTQGRDAQAFDRSIDILVSRLRRKLAATADSANFIVTIRGGGYMFAPSVEAS
ncbi:response regulator [Nordella sp. HKS 07]|uniref:response regulator n=1 Tax=Nordella sp. HKS 07 TaxID=2712222 RepID=UPI0013E144F7|nr:response regulator [Nordella sp. HKS 07]QIG46720.1 response regulator [Nordella sp. HKS 07]